MFITPRNIQPFHRYLVLSRRSARLCICSQAERRPMQAWQVLHRKHERPSQTDSRPPIGERCQNNTTSLLGRYRAGINQAHELWRQSKEGGNRHLPRIEKQARER